MDVPIQKIEYNKGKPVIVVDGHKFRPAFLKKLGEISWQVSKNLSSTINQLKLLMLIL
jgi:transposase-like protein